MSMTPAEFEDYKKRHTATEQYKLGEPTMLYRLGGESQHYERGIGYIDYDYIVVDSQHVEAYLKDGEYFKSINDALKDKRGTFDAKPIDTKQPTKLPEPSPSFKKVKGKKEEEPEVLVLEASHELDEKTDN